MTFTKDILKRKSIVENKDYEVHAVVEFSVSNERERTMSLFDCAFTHLLIEDRRRENPEMLKKEYYEMAIEYGRSFYGSSRITSEHIISIGIDFPTEENEKWSLLYEVAGGDLVIYLNFEGFEFKGIGGSH